MFRKEIRRLFRQGKVTVLGVSGQAGAGKTNYIVPMLMQEAEKQGIPAAKLGLDSFFILSSKDRKKWLEEGKKMSDEEILFRENQINWWNFDRAEQSLYTLKSGKPLVLDNVYNRADKGELTASISIIPPENGLLLFFDGVAIAHLRFIDELWLVHAAGETRFDRLFDRDNDRRNVTEEALRRWELTQRFEKRYFPPNWKKIRLFIDNSAQKENGDIKITADLPPHHECLG